MVAGKCRKISECVLTCVKMVRSCGNFQYERACVLNMWVSEYYQTVESPWGVNIKASIPLQQYQQISLTSK